MRAFMQYRPKRVIVPAACTVAVVPSVYTTCVICPSAGAGVSGGPGCRHCKGYSTQIDKPQFT